jgi:ribosomal protein L37AE/L43A
MVNSGRPRHRRLRTNLQRKRTHSARRRLNKLSGKEQRFARDTNHVISKEIVELAERTKRAGVTVLFVDPRNTSRECPECGHILKYNRPSQAVFKCVECGYAAHADSTAAVNISRRAAVMLPNVPEANDATHAPLALPGTSPPL